MPDFEWTSSEFFSIEFGYTLTYQEIILSSQCKFETVLSISLLSLFATNLNENVHKCIFICHLIWIFLNNCWQQFKLKPIFKLWSREVCHFEYIPWYLHLEVKMCEWCSVHLCDLWCRRTVYSLVVIQMSPVDYLTLRLSQYTTIVWIARNKNRMK